jgi:hypothetical protein
VSAAEEQASSMAHVPGEDDIYRRVIDRLVRDCEEGQGQIGSDRARQGVWNPAAEEAGLEDQAAMNRLLDRLPDNERQVLAAMLEQAFVSGIHQALVSLHETGVVPFDKAYEGTPFHDFIGRMTGWEWPIGESRVE